MAFSVRLAESDATISARLTHAIAQGLTIALRLAAEPIRVRIAQACDGLIQGTEAYQSLLHGKLLGELGIPDVEGRLQQVLGTIRDGVTVTVRPVRGTKLTLVGGLEIGLLKSGYEDLLELSASSYISAPSGEEIRWLDWLLVQGDRVIVAGYDAFFDLTSQERARSRTKQALMQVTKGAGWHVPHEFAGTVEENWLTKTFDVPGVEALLARIIREEIEVRL